MLPSRLFPGLLCALVLLAATSAAQDNTTVIGSAFTGRPFALAGDLVLEDHASNFVIRDFGDAESPIWKSTLEHQWGNWANLAYDDGLAVSIHDGPPFGHGSRNHLRRPHLDTGHRFFYTESSAYIVPGILNRVTEST